MDSLFSISPPEAFDFNDFAGWPNWIRRFERFRIAAGLDKKDQEYQVNSLIYTMGDSADDVLNTLTLEEADKKEYEKVRDAFEKHFICKHNVIYERAKFNKRCQEPGETAEAFITAVHKLADHCQYGDLKEEMIRDRLVVGIKDHALSERLQLDSKLTLTKAITKIRQNEEIKKQQPILRQTSTDGAEGANMDAVRFKHKQKSGQQGNKTNHRPVQTNAKDKCGRCGKFHGNAFKDCPARNADCKKCQKKGHFAALCKSKMRVEEIQQSDMSERVETLFLGTVTTAAPSTVWKKSIGVNGQQVVFKLDTGAAVTAIPKHMYSAKLHGKLSPPNKRLCGPSNTPITVEGHFTANMSYKGSVVKQQVYVVPGLATPLLGLPAIQDLSLLTQVDAIATESAFTKQYPKVFTGLGKLEGEYKIKLKENATPFALAVPRRVPLPLRGKVQEELNRMEAMGVISPIEEATEWCSGMVVVPKPNGKIRICVDLTRLNEDVCRERHILPAVDETLAKLAGARIFSKLDATAGFWQIPLHRESAPLTTFITPFGRFCFNRLPFGISSAPEHFQKRLTQMLGGLDGTVCHADDILVFGATPQEHDERLHRVLQRLQQRGLTLNDKCEFAMTEVKFLGHIVSGEGIRPDPDKIRAIVAMPPPKDVADVKRFMGMVNYVGKFSPNIAELTGPIRDLLKADNMWTWGPAQQTAFAKVKEELSSSAVLAPYSTDKPTRVSADASSYGLGGVLSQLQASGEWRPVAFISRSMTETERRYAQIEKEALAITWACERFQTYLLGLHFQIRTDHKPLLSLLSTRALDDIPPRVLRFRLRLLRFTYNIVHIPGKNLIAADALSRAPLQDAVREEDLVLQSDVRAHINEIIQQLPASPEKLIQIRRAQEEDPVCAQLSSLIRTGWDRLSSAPQLKSYWQYRNDLLMADGLLMKEKRIVIPASMQKSILETLHQGHQGMVKCMARAQEAVWWPGLTSQIKERVRNCDVCVKESHNAPEPLLTTPLPSRPWQKLAADLFEWKKGHYLVVIDYYSRFIEVANLTSTLASAVIQKMKAIFSRHGVPDTLISDNGPQFSATEFAEFAKDYSFQHLTSSPRYPQSNGEAERAVRTVKALLQKNEDPHKALMAYRATPLAHGASPAQLLMGRNIQTPLPVCPSTLTPAWPDLKAFELKDKELKRKQAEGYNTRHRAKEKEPLQPGQRVWIKNIPRTGVVSGSAATPRSYVVDTSNGSLRRNRSHLRVVPSPSTTPDPGIRTRVGRAVKPIQRLNL